MSIPHISRARLIITHHLSLHIYALSATAQVPCPLSPPTYELCCCGCALGSPFPCVLLVHLQIPSVLLLLVRCSSTYTPPICHLCRICAHVCLPSEHMPACYLSTCMLPLCWCAVTYIYVDFMYVDSSTIYSLDIVIHLPLCDCASSQPPYRPRSPGGDGDLCDCRQPGWGRRPARLPATRMVRASATLACGRRRLS